jgi:predicted O-linked N-acetylglucosamine transferase (SPINDLY family)
MDIPSLLRLAAEHVHAQHYGEAEGLYRQVLALRPDEPNALYGLGVVAMAARAYDDAARLIGAAVKKQPKAGLWYQTLGDALRQAGRPDEAREAYARGARLLPNEPLLYNNLGAACQETGRLEEALRAFRRAVDLAPEDPLYLTNLAGVLQKLERYEESLPFAEKASRIAPDYATAWINLGAGLLALARFAEAETANRRALALLDLPETRDNLAEALRCQGKYDEAQAVLAPLLETRPTPHSYIIYAKCLNERRAYGEAESLLRRALARFPDDESLWMGLAENLGAQGRLAEALALTDTLRTRFGKPDFNAAGVVFWLNAVEADPTRALTEARAAAANLGPAPRKAPRLSPVGNRRLRVGYVSPDLRRHSVAFFFEGLLRHHDRERFEIFCYQANEQSDDVTERLRGYGDAWRQVSRWTDEGLARKVREDRIDILVDLAGWTAHNRLGAFARKPAPIQVTYLGYPNTTGLATMDWRLTDPWADPEGLTDPWYTEKLYRLPRVFLAYNPPAGAPAPLSPRPDRPFTFGSFNAIHKVSDRLIRLWGRILAALPEARLFLKTGALSDPKVRERLLEHFAAFGIPTGRIELAPWTKDIGEHLAQYHRVDLALDTFPYHGTTTTCEALWMGTPVLTLAGSTHASRVGVSLLTAVGLDELIAEDDDAYVARACALARDRAQLSALRTGLREKMAASPLLDAAGLARAIEDAYATMARQARG